MPDLAAIAETFSRFAVAEARENLSPLYERLSEIVAEDAELLAVAAETREGQPKPNMLFAAVQYLLADRREDPLAAWYPAFAGGGEPKGDLAGAFRTFLLGHRDEVAALLSTRMVQTNEVRRSALLLPAFAGVLASSGKPLALIEIGPSAGLNLLFDLYHYRYRSFELGDPRSPVRLETEPRLPLPSFGIPSVVSRVGIDLNPLDAANPDDMRWLRALVWPEHDDRRALLDAAVSVARDHPPRLLGGDLFELLPGEVRAAPPEAQVCLFATFVLNQFSPEMLERLRGMLLELSRERPLALLVLGASEFVTGSFPSGSPWTSLWLMEFEHGEERSRHLARCNPHGRWMAWG